MKFQKVILPIVLAATMIFTGCAQQAAAPAPAKVGTAPDGNEAAIEKAAVKLVQDVNEGGYQLVGGEELKGLIDAKKDMIIIDTMPADFYAKGHIPTALNAELPKTGLQDATEDQKKAFEALLGPDKSKQIVVYCGFTACRRSDAGAKLAKELGYTNVYRYVGGIVAWQASEYEVQK